jgi:D-alanyl-D-alanine carboxypeptidase (penicillin-binding protein 5/6)
MFNKLKAVMASIVLLSSASTIAQPELFIDSASHILVEYETGKVLSSENPDTKIYPASLTKMMTAYVVFKELTSGNLSLEDEVKISKKAWKTSGSRSFMQEGKMVKVEDLLIGAIVQSGNDASVALAEKIGGTEGYFVKMMNLYANDLGMKNTNFENSTGFHHKNHKTTARDFYILSKAILDEFPQYMNIFSMKSFKYNDIEQLNRNKLVHEDYYDGFKTGWTPQSRYSIASTGSKNGRRLIFILLSTKKPETRFAEAKKAFNYGYRNFSTLTPLTKGQIVAKVPVYKGDVPFVNIKVVDSAIFTIPTIIQPDLVMNVHIPDKIIWHSDFNETVGKIIITNKNTKTVFFESELVVETPIKQPTILRVIADTFSLFISERI